MIPNAIHALSIPMATFLFMLVFVSSPVELSNHASVALDFVVVGFDVDSVVFNGYLGGGVGGE